MKITAKNALILAVAAELASTGRSMFIMAGVREPPPYAEPNKKSKGEKKRARSHLHAKGWK